MGWRQEDKTIAEVLSGAEKVKIIGNRTKMRVLVGMSKDLYAEKQKVGTQEEKAVKEEKDEGNQSAGSGSNELTPSKKEKEKMREELKECVTQLNNNWVALSEEGQKMIQALKDKNKVEE